MSEEVVCDFCSGTPVKWSYPVKSFDSTPDLPVGIVSSGDWAACDTCYGIIENDPTGESILARQVIEFRAKHPEIPVAYVKMRTREVNEMFFANRIGPPVPYIPREGDGEIGFGFGSR